MSQDFLVTKSNEIIEAKYKISLNEQRLVLASISQIQPENNDFGVYKIRVKDYVGLFNVSSKQIYREIEEVVKRLRTRKILIKQGNSVIDANWVSAAKYSPSEGEITIEFPQLLKPYLLQLKKHFTTYRLRNIIFLKSNYSIRIYEMLKQYERIGIRIISVQELKDVLGIEEGEYKLFGHFNNRVLKHSQKQIQENTDISFTYKTIKKGRRVEEIEFKIFKNTNNCEQMTLPNVEATPFEHQDLYDLIIASGISPRQADKFFKEYTPEQIQRNYDLYKKKKESKEIKSSEKGFLANAIMDDYAYKSDAEIASEEAKKQAKEIEKKLNALKIKKENINKEFLEEIMKLVKNIDAKFTPEERANHRKACEKSVPKVLLQSFRDGKLNSFYNKYIQEIFLSDEQKDLSKFASSQGVDLKSMEKEFNQLKTKMRKLK